LSHRALFLTVFSKERPKRIWNHLWFHDAPLATGFLELNLKISRCKNAPFLASYWAKIKSELNRKHPKLEYNAILISFVVAMLTFSDKLLTLCDQE